MKNIFVIILLMILTGCATTQVLTNPEKPIVMRNIMQKEFDLLPAPNGKKVTVSIELRARSGTFTTPYHAPIQNGYGLFKLRYIEDKLKSNKLLID